MTPAARVQAAIDVLDSMASGLVAEQALSRWARGARYAGSKDRAAVRDHVFSVLRRKDSLGALGGGGTGRALMFGLLRDQGEDPAEIFTGAPYAPPVLTQDEQSAGRAPTPQEARDVPGWLWPLFVSALGAEEATRTTTALRDRAPICLRVNQRKATTAQAIEMLSENKVTAQPVETVSTALLVTQGARAVAQSRAYQSGVVELQDASSQAAVAALEVPKGARVLDFCAGGGGKVLALAAAQDAQWFAHDVAPRRLQDLPARAARAGADIACLSSADLPRHAPFDMVLCDVPCSGSGTWRRTPEAKWALTPQRLEELCLMQGEILQQAAGLLRPGGVLAYSTCSVFNKENSVQVQMFTEVISSYKLILEQHWPVSETGDGFYLAVLQI